MVAEQRLTRTVSSSTTRKQQSASDARAFRRFLVRLGVGVFLGILAISRFASAAADGYALDQMQGQITVAKAQQTSLEAQIAWLTSAGRLMPLATRFKMSPVPAALELTMPSDVKSTVAVSRSQRPNGILAALRAVIVDVSRMLAKL